MNILILTPVHPMQIVEMNELYNKYGQYNNVFSIQAMALLGEETFQQNYAAAMVAYTEAIRKKPKLIKPRGRHIEHTIIYGNIDKRTEIKFDHILGFTNHYAENEQSWDTYLDKIMSEVEEVYKDATKKIQTKIPRYYEQSDAQYIFPTFSHLLLFLRTLKIKENDNDTSDAVQQ